MAKDDDKHNEPGWWDPPSRSPQPGGPSRSVPPGGDSGRHRQDGWRPGPSMPPPSGGGCKKKFVLLAAAPALVVSAAATIWALW